MRDDLWPGLGLGRSIFERNSDLSEFAELGCGGVPGFWPDHPGRAACGDDIFSMEHVLVCIEVVGQPCHGANGVAQYVGSASTFSDDAIQFEPNRVIGQGYVLPVPDGGPQDDGAMCSVVGNE